MMKLLGFFIGFISSVIAWNWWAAKSNNSAFSSAEVVSYKAEVRYLGESGLFQVDETALYDVNGKERVATKRFCEGIVDNVGFSSKQEARSYADSLNQSPPEKVYFTEPNSSGCLELAYAGTKPSLLAGAVVSLVMGALGSALFGTFQNVLSRRDNP